MPSKPIIGFFLRFVLLYGVLMGLWPVAYDAYGVFFKGGTELLYGSLGSSRAVQLRPLPPAERLDENDTQLIFKTGASRNWNSTKISVRDIGYLSTVVVVSLCLATPIPWRRRFRALLAGLVLLHAVIAMRLGILIAALFNWASPDPWFTPDTFWGKAVDAGIVRFALGQPIAYIVSILIWMLVSLRRDDLTMILSRRGGRPRKPPGAKPPAN